MRPLTKTEIKDLEARGCSAADWSRVNVAEPFFADAYRNVEFSGDVELGSARGEFELEGGFRVRAGITDARLHNVRVGEGVYIRSIANYIADYDISDGVFIENVNRIVTRPGSTFGIGTQVSVLNETGGREVPMFERLSAQMAYMLAMYRHNPKLTARLAEIVGRHVESVRSDRGRIGAGARIVNTGTITDLNIGARTVIEGATSLCNGTITGSESDPVFVGNNVMANDFVLAAGSRVEDGVVLRHVFVGQGTHLSHLFSAHDSLFFANCSCENGEACAIFAGPYTVTMHKSSLLIAGMFSFLNAGSGSNQSNHMYKLGPIHQGVVERGSKTTSDSYILWPARIGAFSLVMGRHVTHPDTSRMPFSYLIETDRGSFLVPGANLKSVGTIRDSQKWPKRDRRLDPDKLDCINFNLLSPYTASRMLDGIDLLNEMQSISGNTAARYTFQGMTIESRALESGRRLYAMAVDKFMGNSVLKRLENRQFENIDDVRAALRPTHPHGEGEWVDIAGMIAPKSEISAIIRDIIERKLTSLDQIEARFRRLHSDYYDMEWTWVAANLRRWWGKGIDELEAADIAAITDRWCDSVVSIDNLLYSDARKEFSLVSRTGFGVDGSQSRQQSDFENVRGVFEADPFVNMVQQHIKEKSALAADLKLRIAPLLK